jgi:hypothetical protein
MGVGEGVGVGGAGVSVGGAEVAVTVGAVVFSTPVEPKPLCPHQAQIHFYLG